MAVEVDLLPQQRPGGTDGPDLTDRILEQTQYVYSVVLLAAFIGGAAWYSVMNSKKDEDETIPTMKGPGGKPLPITKKNKRDNGERKIGPDFGVTAKNVFRVLAFVVFLCYLLTGISMFDHAFYHENPAQWAQQGLPWAGEWTVVHVLGSTSFYLYILISLFDWRKGPNIVHLIVWTLGLLGELTMFVTTLIAATGCHFLRIVQNERSTDESCIDSWSKVDLSLYAVRITFLTSLILIYCSAWIRKIHKPSSAHVEEGRSSERTPLLNGGARSYATQGSETISRRGRGRTISDASKAVGASRKDSEAAFYRPQKLPHKTWWEYIRGYSLFFPYLWPKDSLKLQINVLICFILVLIQRLVIVLVPAQMGLVVDKLNEIVKGIANGGTPSMSTLPLFDFAFLGVLWTLQGQSGLLGSVRSLLWIPVSQYSYRGLTTAAFNHVHCLSLDFHLSKRTGEVLSALNKGSAINSFLEQITFQVVPMLIDLFLTIGIFYFRYGSLYAQINLVNTCWYLYMTIKMAATRADQRREMTNADREEEAVKNDSISSYETVKYFNAEEYESKRYQDKVGVFQKAEANVQFGMVVMNIAQTVVFNLGRTLAALVCGWEVSMGRRTPGEWVTVVSYLTQLQGPLNFFGTFYRTVQQAMISGERLLELFKILPTVVDTPHAVPLKDFEGHVQWKNVCFSYDRRRPALRNISFECAPGTTTAFVGESGGGKSTLFRHMFRYYDCDEGSIELDGRNVKDLTIESVRRNIGVVPQDTTLFNETLMYNLKYAKPEATDEEVFEACRAASIHDRILSFPDQYNTQVGERGLRLSGGEKQRVAIARTILKGPKIIMLDEATSALDSHTEQEIQKNVWNIGQGRTLLIIAHRLSTITHADQIIVLNNGSIAERGTHDELLAARGKYSLMWEKQIRAEKALDAAREAQIKAARAMRRANMTKKGDESLPYKGLAKTSSKTSSQVTEEETHSSSPSSSSSSDAESTHTDELPRQRN